MFYKNVELYNVAEIKEGGKILTRIPDDLRVKLNESAKTRALMPAGCELRFNLKSDNAKIILKSTGNEPAARGDYGIAEVYHGNFFHSWHVITDKETIIELKKEDALVNIEKLKKLKEERNLPFDPALTRIVLPHFSTLQIINIEGEFELPDKNQSPKIKYLAYGSSITHGVSVLRPTGTYAMRTAQLLGVDLINLGFGGGAHCESQMADYIAERDDWDFATLELGINMVGGFETEEFKKRVEYFIEKIATTHPDRWIFCIDLFTFYADFDPASTKQNEFRRIVKETVEKLNMPKLIHLDGREILKNPSGLMAGDLLHPSPEGMEEMARNLSTTVKQSL